MIDYITEHEEFQELVDWEELQAMRDEKMVPNTLIALALAMKFQVRMTLLYDSELIHHDYGEERMFVLFRLGVWNVLNFIPQLD